MTLSGTLSPNPCFASRRFEDAKQKETLMNERLF